MLNSNSIADTFERNLHVKLLNFTRNKLETLPKGIFEKTNTLKVVDLSHNGFQILSTEVSNNENTIKL